MNIGNGLNMRVLDSLNFLPMRLSALPKSFGLAKLKKGYFPHFYIGPFPDPNFYGINNMSSQGRVYFQQWYEEQIDSGAQFDFRKEIEEYCVSDVTISWNLDLEVTMRPEEWVEEEEEGENGDKGEGEKEKEVVKSKPKVKVNGVDPFKCTPIAGMCMQIYKTKFFREKYTASIERGLVRKKIEAEMIDGNTQSCLDGSWMNKEQLVEKGWKLKNRLRFR